MGWEQRSRKYLPAGTVCYLCGEVIGGDQDWNKDHVPPLRFYGKSIRAVLNPNLDGLHTHTSCNTSYKADEEYYAATFSRHADSAAGRSVVADWQRGIAKGHDAGLLKTINSEFGRIVRPDGMVVTNYDVDRAGRVTWKLVRGIYFAEVKRFLPNNLPKRLTMLSPHENQHAHQMHPWWPHVRDTRPMGSHGEVFDYKWLCTIMDGIRTHAVGMLLWDRLLVFILFHDPSCPCAECDAAARVRTGESAAT